MQEHNVKPPFGVINSLGGRRLLVVAVCAPLVIVIFRMIAIGEQSLMDVRSVICVILMGLSIHTIIAFCLGWEIIFGPELPLKPNETAGRVGALIVGILIYLFCSLYLFEKLGFLVNY